MCCDCPGHKQRQVHVQYHFMSDVNGMSCCFSLSPFNDSTIIALFDCIVRVHKGRCLNLLQKGMHFLQFITLLCKKRKKNGFINCNIYYIAFESFILWLLYISRITTHCSLQTQMQKCITRIFFFLSLCTLQLYMFLL